MVKRQKSILIVLLVCTLFLTVFLPLFSLPFVLSVEADDEVNYKKKIVSVVFDNSGSMIDGQKTPLAKYSLQTLAASLGTNDTLIVCPMNQSNGRDPFSIDLTKDDRTDEIASKINKNNNSLNGNGLTPLASVDNAIAELVKNGMQKTEELANEELDKEYWLIVLTDGQFDNLDDETACATALEERIKGYAGLNTVYMSFGSGAFDLTNTDLSKNYPFSAYYAKEAVDVIDAMEDVSNKILGKYGADAKTYEVADNTLTIDLDKFDFAVNSVSVLAQNCGAEFKNATYNGKEISPAQRASLNSYGVTNLSPGYVAVFKNDEYMSGGKLVLVYDKSLNDVSVLIEPAIFIDAYVEYLDNGSWKKTDMQFINSNLMPGDQIRIGYNVLNAANHSVIDTKTIFGEHVEKVTYCGSGYKIGETIELHEGNNEIAITVEVLGGRYAMRSSLMCYVEKDPTYYRIESVLKQGEGEEYKKANVVFTVFVHDQRLSKTEIDEKYDWTVEATDPAGQSIEVSKLLNENGEIQVDFDGTALGFGKYNIKARVVNKESNIARTTTQAIALVPKSMSVSCLNEGGLQISEYRLRETSEKVEFELVLDGVTETFKNDIIDYKVTIGGVDITSKCTVDDKKIVYVVDTASLTELGALKVGKKQIKIEASALGGLTAQAVYDFEILASVYRVEKLDYGERTFDRYDISKTNAGTYFQVYRDEVLIPVEEIQEALDDGEITINTNPFGWITLLPCKVDVVVTELDGEPVIACMVGSDVFKPLDNLLGSFIFPNEKDITLSYNGVSVTDTVFMSEVSFASRVIRWGILLAIILFILHLILFAIGFLVAKPLPKGTLLYIRVRESAYTERMTINGQQQLNMSAEDIILWHLSRLIPFREFKDQKPKKLQCGGVSLIFKVDKTTRKPICELQGNKALIEYAENYSGSKDSDEVERVVDGYAIGRKEKKINVNSRSFLRFFRKTNEVYKCGKDGNYIIHGITEWYGIHKIESERKTTGPLEGFIVFKPKRK